MSDNKLVDLDIRKLQLATDGLNNHAMLIDAHEQICPFVYIFNFMFFNHGFDDIKVKLTIIR